MAKRYDGLRERWWPHAFSIVGVAIWLATGRVFPDSYDGLLTAAATASAVIVGFLAATISMVLSIASSRVFKKLKEIGADKDLIDYLRSSFTWAILLLVLSVAGFFVSVGSIVFYVFTTLWFTIALLTLFTYIRVTLLSFKLFQKV